MGFLQRVGIPVVSQVTQLGDRPNLERLLGAIKVQIEAFQEGRVDVVYIAYSRFINAMKQEPVIEQLLPLPKSAVETDKHENSWDYIYEPSADEVLKVLLKRYVEALIYQAVAENMASEQSARMVAMKPLLITLRSLSTIWNWFTTRHVRPALPRKLPKSSVVLLQCLN